MANRHSKLDSVDLEESPGIPGHIELILTRGELVLGLVSLNLASGVNDNGDNLPPRLREPFHPEDRGHRIRSRPLRHGLEYPFLLRPIKRDDFKILASQSHELGVRR